jgi:hypothetical protein
LGVERGTDAAEPLAMMSPSLRRVPARAAVLMLSLCALGCYPVTRFTTPTVLEPGMVQAAAAVATNGATGAAPDIAVRGGVAENIEIGVRVRPVALEVGGKFQLVRGALEVSVAPGVLVARDADIDHLFDEWQSPEYTVTVMAARGTVFLGTDSSHVVSAWLAPSMDGGTQHVRDDSTSFAALGMSMGAAVGAASARTRLLIEVAGLWPFGGPRYAEGPDGDPVPTRLGPHDRRVEASVGLLRQW